MKGQLKQQPYKKILLFFIFNLNFFNFYKMESIKNQNEAVQKPKNQSVEGKKIYKTRKYVQSTKTRLAAETRRKRNQYIIDHKEEILKYDGKSRFKKAIEMIKQDLNLDVNYKTIYPIINKYVLTDVKNENAEARKLRDQYLKDHKEEILKLDDNDRIKKVAELLKQDLNLDVNDKLLKQLLKRFCLTDITNPNAEARRKRDQYLIDHREEILKLEPRGKIKKVQEMLKKDLNLDVNYNKLYLALTKFDLL